MKRKLEKALMGLGIVFIILFLIVLIALVFPAKYELEFLLNDVEPLEGDVYFEGDFMGSTNSDGIIRISENRIGPGELRFSSKDKSGEEYSIYFDMLEEDYDDSYYIPFTITDEDIIFAQTDISDINESKLEDDVFRIINEKREENFIEKVERNKLLDDVAQDYAERIKETDLFAHTPEEGYDVGKRFEEKEIFYLSQSEVLSRNYFYSEEEFAYDVVDGWISSPGHRSTVLDADKPVLWESLGVGVSCKDDGEGIVCYVVGVFANLKLEISDDLEEEYYIAYELYPEGFPYSYSTTARIIFDSTREMDLILLPSLKEYEVLLDANSYDEIFYERSIDYYDEIIDLEKGYVLVPHATRRNSEYNLTVLYNQ